MVPIRATTTDQAEDSWLVRAITPLQRLIRFRNQQRWRREDEDSRLASLAAALVVQPQPRVFPPNTTTVALVGCGRMGTRDRAKPQASESSGELGTPPRLSAKVRDKHFHDRPHRSFEWL